MAPPPSAATYATQSRTEGCVQKHERKSIGLGKSVKSYCAPDNLKNAVFNKVPIISWLPKYNVKESMMGDIVAGLTVGVMLVPQGMAYALLAGLPPAYGLYSSVIPILVYALFGTSRQLAVGPTAIMGLLVFEGVHSLTTDSFEPTEAEVIEIAFILSFLVGILNLIFSVFRLGVVAQLLSHSVLVGFTSGAAVIIGLSQLKHVVGFAIPSNPFPLYKLGYAFSHIAETNVASLLIALITIILLLLLRTMKRRIVAQEKAERSGDKAPANYARARSGLKLMGNMSALIVVLLGTAITASVDAKFGDYTVKIVGTIDSGYPAPRAPALGSYSSDIPKLMVPALIMAVLGFMESYAVGSNYAKKNGYKVDPNQELVALGAANLIGSFFNSFPVTGGFSRTAVNADSGAKTPLASILSVIVIVFVLFVLTDALFYLPNPVLAGIIFVAVSGLFNLSAVRLAWKVNRRDFAVIAATFIATVAFGVEIGIIVGLGASFANVLQGFSRPHYALLGKVTSPDTGETIYRNLRRYPNAQVENVGIVVVRVDAPIWFANAEYIHTVIYNAATKPTSRRGDSFVSRGTTASGEVSPRSRNSTSSVVAVSEHGAVDDATAAASGGVVLDMGPSSAPVIDEARMSASSLQQQHSQMTNDSTRFVIVDCAAVDSIDITGLEALMDLQSDLNGVNIGLLLAGVKGPVRDKIKAFNVQHHKAHPTARALTPWVSEARDDSKNPMNVMTRTIGEAEDLIEAKFQTEIETGDRKADVIDVAEV